MSNNGYSNSIQRSDFIKIKDKKLCYYANCVIMRCQKIEMNSIYILLKIL